MDERVKKFIDAAKAAERQRFENERDSLLISLGLVDPAKTRREYADYYSVTHSDWDAEKGKYYRDVVEPIEVSDEEYEEINGLSLTIGVITSIVLFVIAINAYKNIGYMLLSAVVVLLISFVSWAIVKVVLNVSNNLHKINSKIK